MKRPDLECSVWWIWVNTYSDTASLVTQMVKNLPVMWETQVQSLGREVPLEKEIATHSSTLALGNPVDRGAWRATVHGVTEGRTPLSDWPFLPYTLVKLQDFTTTPESSLMPLSSQILSPTSQRYLVLSFSPSGNLIWNLVSMASGSVLSLERSFPPAHCVWEPPVL